LVADGANATPDVHAAAEQHVEVDIAVIPDILPFTPSGQSPAIQDR
jgi:hypothetical protein